MLANSAASSGGSAAMLGGKFSPVGSAVAPCILIASAVRAAAACPGSGMLIGCPSVMKGGLVYSLLLLLSYVLELLDTLDRLG